MSNQPNQMQTTNNPSRRQALNACEACRKRKTKCDERKPACARCTRLGLECMYIETVAAKKNLSIEELTGTLKRMDEKLDVLTAFAQQNDGHHQAPTTGLASSPGNGQFAAFSPLNLGGTGLVQNASTPFLDTGRVLGSIVAHYSGHEEWSSGNEQDIGLGFFNLANDMFRDLEGGNWESVQCLLLMGLFYSAKLRVYDAWQANHKACCTVSILVPLQRALEAQHCQLFWIAYLQERSQILAEFDFPASGLGKLASSMPLPVIPGAGTDPRHAQYQFFFLALISMRKLLNRILFHLYSRDHTENATNGEPTHIDKPATFMSVSSSVIFELDRQLEEWRTCLPQGLEFLSYSEAQLAEDPQLDQTRRSTDERLRGHLQARYFAAKRTHSSWQRIDVRGSKWDLTGAIGIVASSYQFLSKVRYNHRDLNAH
ncbi:hypothetical protein NW760_006262 [Fusarium oxysporum]|nr:hypothetical protein NW753_006673 [Fusarium oxysporum]KAJ4231463.1 hypothetical protein NW760_006262 [Fusarium oxysporum]